jgi:hypothetical protein
MDRRQLRGGLRERTVWLGWLFLALGPVSVLFFDRSLGEGLFFVVLGGGILLWLRPWRADWHDAWVVRVEPEPADVAAGRSFDPYYVPECNCGWDDPYYDDPAEARAAAHRHAKGRVEPEQRLTHEPVTD